MVMVTIPSGLISYSLLPSLAMVTTYLSIPLPPAVDRSTTKKLDQSCRWRPQIPKFTGERFQSKSWMTAVEIWVPK